VIILPAIALGFAGSMHCVGMCGPIAMAVPVGSRNPVHRFFAYSTCHTGRVAAYAILGFLFGVLGAGLDMAGLQQGLSLGLGVLMLAFIWLPKGAQFFRVSGALAKYQSKVNRYMAKRLKSQRASALLGLGFVNGLLPCGLVYIALAASMATYDPFLGAGFMALFGLGTIPALAALVFTGNKIGPAIRLRLKRVLPVIATLFAIVFILRGLGLGIPYVSPDLNSVVTTTENCAP